MFERNGCNANDTMKDPRKEEFNGYEAQNGGTGPYLSSPCTPRFDLKLRGFMKINVRH